MVGTCNPFVDPIRSDALYRDVERLARRTSALHRAKVAGRPVAGVLADLAIEQLAGRNPGMVADVGCGRGTTALGLAERLRPAHLVAVDRSFAVLMSARARMTGLVGEQMSLLRADFHRLPIRDGACGLVVAAFCLYHSSRPADAIAELARCLAPAGLAIMVTKSIDSYRSLDQLVASSGLDPHACRRPSLYKSAHSANLAALAAPSLTVRHVEHHEHQFTFADLGHVAEYMATSPKYEIPLSLEGDAARLAEAMRRRLPDEPLTTTSVVTYVVGAR